MQQDFWKRLRIEYLNELQVRSKWRESKHNLKIASVVLLKDERLPPAQWVLGRVLEVHHGADGLVRVATVRTSTSTVKRAISKIVPLPFNDCSDGSNGGRGEPLNISSQDLDEVGGNVGNNRNMPTLCNQSGNY